MLDLEFFNAAASERPGAMTVVVLDEERALTELEVEDRLARLSELNAQLDSARSRCDQLKNHYAEKIQRAEEIFQADTADLRAEIDSLTIGLRRYAEANITGKKRSLNLPSGRLSFRKRQPQFFMDDAPVVSDNPALIQIARSLDADLVKTKETADWAELKKRLDIDESGNVYLKDTGEVVPNMRAKQLPDDFTIKTF